ncbi:hypothetical protein HZF24_05025 [Sedimentibacter hydroxybenzoicus DSM 7310]|uniref:Uncharacterized protein n=1 Tax=Sedimentibacter hydroxybenzoicus DSM 7310 TaxID=1123245 RepID=A0A974BI19_SEDHY|nr:hypothetical protein [Sedimentibacter hydroxybenzoicus]NYB73497.1 hypothetical protein [Sedimentibacter hydroxybenzoicus DSM 7310]
MNMVNNNQLRIKDFPKEISKIAQERFIKGDNLIINLKEINISPIQSVLIVLYYYDYLSFIYKAGKGLILYKQIERYMKEYQNISVRHTRNVIEEMYFYRLIEKSNKWGNCYIKMTNPSYRFFSNGKNLKKSQEIGSLKRNIFITEHYLRYKPDMRESFINIIAGQNILQAERLEQLEKHNIFLENITKDKEDNLIIHFGLLDISSTININTIKEKIELINSFFNLNYNNIHFRLNINTQDNTRYQFLKNKWNKSTPYVKATRFKSITFTNLSIKRYFTFNADSQITEQ